MSAGQTARGLLLGLSCGLGFALAVAGGLVALVAFGDARHQCPGAQCRDLLGAGSFGVVLVVAGLALAWTMARRLAARGTSGR